MPSLIDSHGRKLTYLRLAVTDKCNMRCTYCLPEKGVVFLKKDKLLSFEEMLRLCKILIDNGIDKIRLTGGEPFLRKSLIDFIIKLTEYIDGSKIHITTNGTAIRPHLQELRLHGIKHLNLSLDSMDRERFKMITRTDHFDMVMDSLDQMLDLGYSMKINAVVMQDKNIEDLVALTELARQRPIGVRFIEEMPFNGFGKNYENWHWDHKAILSHLQYKFPDLEPMYTSDKTSTNYTGKDFKGSVGIIAAWSRTFCGTCDRLRITPEGVLRTCLYERGVFSLRDLIREGASDVDIIAGIQEAVAHKAKDGLEAQHARSKTDFVQESMATIGG